MTGDMRLVAMTDEQLEAIARAVQALLLDTPRNPDARLAASVDWERVHARLVHAFPGLLDRGPFPDVPGPGDARLDALAAALLALTLDFAPGTVSAFQRGQAASALTRAFPGVHEP